MRAFAEAVFWLFGKVPLGGRVAFGCFLGWVFHSVVRFRRAVVEDQMRRSFPEWDEQTLRRVVRDHYRHLGLLIAESLKQPTMVPEDVTDIYSVTGEEQFRPLFEQERGVFVLSGHIGNWELGMARAAQYVPNDAGAYAITKRIKGVLAQHMATRMRTRHGIQPIPRRKAIRQIRKALRTNSAVGFVLDQNMTRDEGVFVEFFGRPACTMPGLAILASRYRCPVIPVTFHRADDLRHHHLAFRPPIEWEEPHEDHDRNVLHNTQRYTAILEDCIREHPAQWLWIHKRWRTVTLEEEQRAAGMPPAQTTPTPSA